MKAIDGRMSCQNNQAGRKRAKGVSVRIALALLLCGFGFSPIVQAADTDAKPAPLSDSDQTRLHRREPIRPLTRPPLDPRKVALGQRLFHDPLLSRDGSISCAKCHDLSRGGADSVAHSTGINGAEGSINTPTVYNSCLNLAQFWDGRVLSLEQQVEGPITNPVEMGSDWPTLLDRLKNSPYGAEFNWLYHRDPRREDVEDAIATFERSLVTVGSRFDQWLLGDNNALTPAERKGYDLFKSLGCISCHQGANVGGNMYQKFGFFGNWFIDRGQTSRADLGRFNITGREEDRYVFKVPGLRLVTLTPPYFHDGSVADLPTAIRLMARYQLGREIDETSISLIAAFLGTLAGPMIEPPPDRAAPNEPAP